MPLSFFQSLRRVGSIGRQSVKDVGVLVTTAGIYLFLCPWDEKKEHARKKLVKKFPNLALRVEHAYKKLVKLSKWIHGSEPAERE